MSKRDLFHESVRRGLEKEEWHISHDPLILEWQDTEMRIDIAAERLIGAERNGQKIAVEVKSFASASPINEFHTALGQFLNYRTMLEILEPGRQLYLAVPQEAYKTFFQKPFTKTATELHNLKMIVYEPVGEELVQWIK